MFFIVKLEKILVSRILIFLMLSGLQFYSSVVIRTYKKFSYLIVNKLLNNKSLAAYSLHKI